ncbi:hypothetical protein Asi03nite_72850 [Actinoplanes siamensis]|uniref:Uncharacterized protein n=1 Tax=Actinoplanes siamensis TaxID=1223317 RepID=A0A919NEE9_9ACTN|nr:hypothetical protein Asi03nite_72850 [Actinoplanes siamensis]
MWGALALLVSMLVAPTAARAAPPALPGGKANWVVSVGGLNNNYDPRNWVRLGYYVFNADGTAETNFWSWNEADSPERINTVKANCDGAVPHCYIRTVEDFDGSPTGGLRGSFDYDASGRLVVTWKTDKSGADITDLRETWNLQTGLVGGKLARITSPTYYTNSGTASDPDVPDPVAGEFSSYSATFGIGYGSTTGFGSDTRASMSDLVNDSRYNTVPYRGTFVRVNNGSLDREGTGGNWTFSGAQGDNNANPWQKCAGAECLGFVQHATSCRSTEDPPNADKDRARYLAEIGGGRRNTEEYWCMLLASGADCYVYNSHPRPMLQIIDDDGTFQGWVGAEAFSHVSTSTGKPDEAWNQYYWGIFDTVSPDAQPAIPPSGWNGSQAVPRFTVPDGANVATGDLLWATGALHFSGRNFVAGGCHYVELLAVGTDGTRQRGTSSPLCAGVEADGTRAFRGSLSFAQNPASVVITYWNAGSSGASYSPGSTLNCTPAGCTSADRKPFRIVYGANVASGSVTWIGPTVQFEGNNHVASECRYVELTATGSDGTARKASSSKFCASGGDRTFGPQVIADVAEGTDVQITYWQGATATGPFTLKASATCRPTGCQ